MIPIRNVYYMLSYAFQLLQEQGYKDVLTEEFDNTADLFSSILIKGISLQLKRGLNRDYVEVSESMSTIKGKIDMPASIKSNNILKSRLVCSHDEFSENTYFNRILKTTVKLLLKEDISKSMKKELKNLLPFFANVETLDEHNINWRIKYNRNNQSYHLLLSICRLVINGLLQSQQNGTDRLMNLIDEKRMCRLYEKFILEYYRKHYPSFLVNAEKISWQLDDGMGDMLPVMQSDIMLKNDDKVLIIDAKYYGHTTQLQYDKHTLHSANLYQIFTYVKNKEYELMDRKHKVCGMLLYARTDEEIVPNHTYYMSGNRIDVRTLDLNCDFSVIRSQLDMIIKEFFA